MKNILPHVWPWPILCYLYSYVHRSRLLSISFFIEVTLCKHQPIGFIVCFLTVWCWSRNQDPLWSDLQRTSEVDDPWSSLFNCYTSRSWHSTLLEPCHGRKLYDSLVVSVIYHQTLINQITNTWLKLKRTKLITHVSFLLLLRERSIIKSWKFG